MGVYAFVPSYALEYVCARMYACVCTCTFAEPTWSALVKIEGAFDQRLVSLGVLYSLVDPRQRVFMPLFDQSLFVFRNEAIDPNLIHGKERGCFVVIRKLDL